MYFSMSSPKNSIKTNKNIEMKNNSNNFFTCKYCGKINEINHKNNYNRYGKYLDDELNNNPFYLSF